MNASHYSILPGVGGIPLCATHSLPQKPPPPGLHARHEPPNPSIVSLGAAACGVSRDKKGQGCAITDPRIQITGLHSPLLQTKFQSPMLLTFHTHTHSLHLLLCDKQLLVKCHYFYGSVKLL